MTVSHYDWTMMACRKGTEEQEIDLRKIGACSNVNHILVCDCRGDPRGCCKQREDPSFPSVAPLRMNTSLVMMDVKYKI